MNPKQLERALKLATPEQLASALGSQRKPSCGHDAPDSTCKLCKQREYRRARRKEGKDK